MIFDILFYIFFLIVSCVFVTNAIEAILTILFYIIDRKKTNY